MSESNSTTPVDPMVKLATRTIAIDPKTQLFYKGIGAGNKVNEALSSHFPTPIDEKSVAAWWFYVGLAAGGEHGLTDEDDIVMFLQGATTQAPSIAASLARHLSDIAQAAAEKVIDLVVSEKPTAKTVRLQCRNLGGGEYGYDPHRATVVLEDGTVEEFRHPELHVELLRRLAADAEEPVNCWARLTIDVETAEVDDAPAEW